MSSRPSALLLAPESPYPIAGGGALRTASLVEYLGAHYELDAIVFRQPEEGAPFFPPGLVREMAVIDLPRHSVGRAAKITRNLGRLLRGVPPLVDRFAGFESKVAGFVRGRRYASAFIEHSWCAPYLEVLAPCAARMVLDLHNVESELHARCAESERVPAALAHRRFREASLALEREWFPRFDLVLAPSSQDCERVSLISPAAKVRAYPNALPLLPQPVEKREHTVIFTGNLEYHPNVTAMRWFHRDIWPAIATAHPGVVWRVAGKNEDRARRMLSSDPLVRVDGAMDNAIAEIARARVAVVPLLAGSGTRFKILEAWAAGTPVVSTPIGAEGLPARDGKNLLLASSPAEFARAVGALLDSTVLAEAIAREARREYENGLTWETGWKLLQGMGI